MQPAPATAPPRIAVIGGDARVRRASWPKRLDIRFYECMGAAGNRPLQKLVSACERGIIDHVIILTKWNSHNVQFQLRPTGVKMTFWSGSAAELAKRIQKIAEER